MRWFLAAMSLTFLAGCTQTRLITINTKPADAYIKVEGVDRGRAPVIETFTFKDHGDAKRITASKVGFKDRTIQITQDFDRNDITLELKPQTRRVHVSVAPVPAVVSVDGKPFSTDAIDTADPTLEFTVDARNNWTTHRVTAEHPGYEPAEVTINWSDQNPNYTLTLEPKKKDLKITSDPPGATVTIDGEVIGKTPLQDNARPFTLEPQSNTWVPHRIKVEKAGYDAIASNISWDDGKTDYHFDFVPKTKTVRIVTDPPGAMITIDGKEAPRGSDGAAAPMQLIFPATDDKGTLKTYTAVITKKTLDTEWEPAKLTIAWDDGRTDYSVQLKEILTRPVPLLTAQPTREDDGGKSCR